MKTATITITVHEDDDDDYDDEKHIAQVRLIRVMPSKCLPADCVPDIVDQALALLKDPMVKLYIKHRN